MKKVIDFENQKDVDNLLNEIKKSSKQDKSKIIEKIIRFGMKHKEVLIGTSVYFLLSGVGLNIYWAFKHYLISLSLVVMSLVIYFIIKLVNKIKSNFSIKRQGLIFKFIRKI